MFDTMEKKILKIQNELFEHLYNSLSLNEGLRFSLRKSNLGDKLDRGYWFHGGLNYVAVSFWSGFDNINRTPNISFIVNSDESCHLLFSARDSELKTKFFIEKLYPSLGISSYNENGQKSILIEGSGTYFEKIDNFISNNKVKIDALIKNENSFFERSPKHSIGFIDGRDFRLLLNRVIKLRDMKNSIIQNDEPVNITKLSIRNFGPIDKIDIPNFGLNKKWIFLTGENGCGKSAIFRAITVAFCNDHKHLIQGDYSNYKIDLELTQGGKKSKRIFDAGNAYKDRPKLLFKGFAAYGASRLSLEDLQQKNTLSTYNTTSSDSIFLNCHPLLDLWTRITELQKRVNSPIAHVRLDNIREVLYSIIENLKTILFPGEFDEKKTYYIELDKNTNKGFPPVPYDYLASGIRSIIAMVGDLIVRFFEQQPSALSPSEFKGIVIIDEIDVHLHPLYQKNIIETLDKIFPKVQFIVSTHSPIPLIGAPKKSAIFVVKRDSNKGVTIKALKKLDISNMLPNNILTSPIFGMNQISSKSNTDNKKIIVDNLYNDFNLFKLVEKRIDQLSKDIKD